jgi:[acyl-carrier-protein] S-malonyltransferase
VAVVGGRPITHAQLERRVAEMRRGPLGRHLPPAGDGEPSDLRRHVARQLVTEEVLRREAAAAGIAPGLAGLTGVVAPLVEWVTAGVTVPEPEVRAYYERNIDRYRVAEGRRVRHILVADEPAAKRLLEHLPRRPFAELARRWSIDAWTRAAGGDLGIVRRGELAGPLEEAVFAAPVGSIVGPIQSMHGWHLVQVEARVPERHEPYERIRDDIRAELLAAARERVFGEWLEERRVALGIMARGYGHPADPTDGPPSHRH